MYAAHHKFWNDCLHLAIVVRLFWDMKRHSSSWMKWHTQIQRCYILSKVLYTHLSPRQLALSAREWHSRLSTGLKHFQDHKTCTSNVQLANMTERVMEHTGMNGIIIACNYSSQDAILQFYFLFLSIFCTLKWNKTNSAGEWVSTW